MSEVPTETHGNEPEASAAKSRQQREYEQSGLYPPEGKSFRIWALLGWLAGVIVVLAGVSALLNILMLG